MNKRTPTCSLSRPEASRRIRLKKVSAHQRWLTQAAPVLLQLNPGILDYTVSVGKYISNTLKVSPQQQLTSLLSLCTWSSVEPWHTMLASSCMSLHRNCADMHFTQRPFCSPTGDVRTLKTVSQRNTETQTDIIHYGKRLPQLMACKRTPHNSP